MAYDRRGKIATTPSSDAESQSATPNAARIQGGRPVKGKAPANRAAGGKNTKRDARAASAPRRIGGRSRTIVRVLPVLVFAAALLISVKAVGIWDTLKNGRSPVTVAAFAEADSPATRPAASGQAEPEQVAQATEPAADKEADKPLDPVLFTRSEIELLQDLSKRRKELDAREQAVIQKEGLLTAAEDRIEKKIVELEAVRAEIESLIKTYDEQEEEEIKGLVQIYEKMKPKDAARIFDELDMDILLRVFDRMKASKSAPVLANMRPQKAKEVTSRIAERKSIPLTTN
ncbi:hypothetical protein NUH88_02050 [Nisaea acidiphila]|uniref:Magnesium transporter MgtE intracellular domain-containing protein n=1 Tax=Nisaea acidiphila TaxID=1862145 RepID=A0A9J7AVI8_9PROT|nr:hypothetical protein [Nisaea acidiphila]UUX50481.1 hypothetical protein NUH88_02050 [Nisaea acidiphila]